MKIKISDKILAKLPKTNLGIILGSVQIKDNSILDALYDDLSLHNHYMDTRHEIIMDTRKAYKILGKKPSRYRPSAEALRRRLNKGKTLNRINNLIDTINIISIKTGYSIGAFDADKVKGEIILDIGDTSPYIAIGKGPYNIDRLPCLYDDLGPFGNPSSDSERTKLTNQTNKILVVIYDFMSNDGFSESFLLAQELLKKYCNLKPKDQ